MPIIKVNEELIKFPDSMSLDEIKKVLDRDFGPTSQAAPTKSSPVTKGDFSFDVPSPDGKPFVQQPAPAEPTFSMGEYIRALPEAIGTAVTSGTTGILGQAGGFAEQYAKELMSGELGTQAAARRIQETAMRRGQQLSMTPESPAAKQLLANVGEFTQPLQSLDPVISQQLMAGLQTSGAASAMRRDIPTQEAALAAQQPAFEAAQRAGITVMRTDVSPPTTSVGGMAQRAGERIPFIGTGGMRRTQQRQRIEATRQLFEDAGITEYQDISDNVMKDLLRTRGEFITKYKNDKDEVIARLSEPTFIKQAGEGKFVETARPVEMKNLNSYLENQLVERGLLRQAEAGDVQASTLVREIRNIQNNFQDSRLFDVEAKRKRLGERFADPSLATIRNEGQQIVNGAYKAIVDDMGDFIETYGGKADKLQWKRANRNLKDNIDDLKDRAFSYALRSGEAKPELITKTLLSNQASRIKVLYKNLSPQGRKDANRLFLNEAYNATVKDGSINPEKFNNFLKQHKHVLDNMDEAQRNELKGFSSALDLTARGQKAEFIPDTGAMNQIPVLATMASVILGDMSVPVLALGGAATTRYIESPLRVRKAFQRLGKAPKNSNAEKIAFNALNAAMIAENNRLAKQAQKEAEMRRALQEPPLITVTRGQPQAQ